MSAAPEPALPAKPGSARRLFGNAGIYAIGTLALQGLSAVFTPLELPRGGPRCGARPTEGSRA